MKNALALIVFLLSTFTSIAQMQMEVDPAIKESELKVVNQKKIFKHQKMQVGEYNTSAVQRSWTKTNSDYDGFGINFEEGYMNILGTKYTKRKQTLSFKLTNGDMISQVFCASEFDSEDMYIGENENSIVNIGLDLLGKGGSSTNYYFVEIYIMNESEPWVLILDNQASQRSPDEYSALLIKNEREYYRLVPENRVEDPKKGRSSKIPFGTVGFRITDTEGLDVGAYSLMDPQRVYIKEADPKARFVLANLCAALLLQQQI